MARTRLETLRARELRQRMNPAERKLWRALRQYSKQVIQIRRQHPCHGFFLDFYCPSASLGLELDGGSHEGKDKYDAWRSAVIAKDGIDILRVPNDWTDEGNVDTVAQWFIRQCLERTTL